MPLLFHQQHTMSLLSEVIMMKGSPKVTSKCLNYSCMTPSHGLLVGEFATEVQKESNSHAQLVEYTLETHIVYPHMY